MKLKKDPIVCSLECRDRNDNYTYRPKQGKEGRTDAAWGGFALLPCPPRPHTPAPARPYHRGIISAPIVLILNGDKRRTLQKTVVSPALTDGENAQSTSIFFY
jgi:hypothetical protein